MGLQKLEEWSASIFLILLSSGLCLGTIILTPNYDHEMMKFLDYKNNNLLICNISGTTYNPDLHIMKWLKNDVPLEEVAGYESKFEIKDNKLTIRRPLDDDDIGNYSCVVKDKKDKNEKSPHLARADIQTAGKPTAKLHAPVTVIEGEKLKLECIVTGKPPPVVEWRYESKKLEREQGGRIQLKDSPEKGIVNAFLEISPAEMSDRGRYFCIAHNVATYSGFNATEADTFVRVKEKLAALWPFIGICAEVVVLCAIIFVYERKRNKTELDESDTDQSPEQKNTPDHGKESVRQRK